jgi:4-cresol dehydrogenase (hydroxylating)
VDLAEGLFERYGFDLPVTLTFVTPSRLIATMSCSFDRADPGERERAHELLHRLHEEYREVGIEMYREGILSMDRIHHRGAGRVDTLRRLKSALDPLGVLAPGRYGVG